MKVKLKVNSLTVKRSRKDCGWQVSDGSGATHYVTDAKFAELYEEACEAKPKPTQTHWDRYNNHDRRIRAIETRHLSSLRTYRPSLSLTFEGRISALEQDKRRREDNKEHLKAAGFVMLCIFAAIGVLAAMNAGL